MLNQLEELAEFYVGSFAESPGFGDLWRLAHPPRIGCMRWNSHELLPPRTEGAWKKCRPGLRDRRDTRNPWLGFEAVDAALRRIVGGIASDGGRDAVETSWMGS